MIFVNFKTYEQGTGEKAIALARVCEEVKKKVGVEIVLVVQAVDIFRLTKAVGLPVWAQHVDGIEFGANTGQVLTEAVLGAGAKGAILNHSENKVPTEVVGEAVERLKSLGMKALICSESIEEAEEMAKAGPDFLAYEPLEFIGSREISVAKARPEVILNFVGKFPDLAVIVGAGVHCREDVEVSLKLGAKGILVATDVVLAKDAGKELTELARGFG
jgi:triosephosphate isomerase